MNKIISFVLFFSLMLTCFSGCSILNNPTDKGDTNNNVDKISSNSQSGDTMELNDVFEMIRADAEVYEKLRFFVEFEQIHNELKSSGQYDDCVWEDAVFIITVDCDYETAINEDWYKQCEETDTKSLNAAFYNNYSAGLSNGKYSNIVFSPGMHLNYKSQEGFVEDYATIKAMADLHYVAQVNIGYYYSMPDEYFME